MCGIYIITNQVNGKAYIGQAVDIRHRFYNHRCDAFNPNDKKYNYPLYKAFRKYGLKNFSFEILEECDRSELNEKEIYYIAKYNSYYNGYNQTKGGNSPPYVIFSDDKIDMIIERLKTSTDNSKIIAEEFGVSQRLVIGINSGEYRRRDNEQYPIRQHLNKIKSQLSTINKQPATRTTKSNQKKRNKVQKVKVRKAKVVNRCQNCGAITKFAKSKLCPACMHLSQRKVERPEPLELAKLIRENGFEAVGRMFNVSGKAISKWCVEYEIPSTKKEVSLWYEEQIGIERIKQESECKTIQKGLVKPVNQIDPSSGKVINTFRDQTQAAEYFGRKDGSNIGRVCRGERKTAFGYLWEFA